MRLSHAPKRVKTMQNPRIDNTHWFAPSSQAEALIRYTSTRQGYLVSSTVSYMKASQHKVPAAGYLVVVHDLSAQMLLGRCN